jgi:hypothetical protein
MIISHIRLHYLANAAETMSLHNIKSTYRNSHPKSVVVANITRQGHSCTAITLLYKELNLKTGTERHNHLNLVTSESSKNENYWLSVTHNQNSLLFNST